MFNGSLIRVGNYAIPLSKARYESYKVTYSTLDLDSYRDANGNLHREALEHKVAKVELNLINMTNSEMNEILSNIRANYTNEKEKKASVQCYIPETDSYVTSDMYMPDITFSIRNVDTARNIVNYNETRIAFIGY